jgi:hypothetical protein
MNIRGLANAETQLRRKTRALFIRAACGVNLASKWKESNFG